MYLARLEFVNPLSTLLLKLKLEPKALLYIYIVAAMTLTEAKARTLTDGTERSVAEMFAEVNTVNIQTGCFITSTQ